MAPVAPLLPQLPQVSQVRVSSTLSRTVAPAGGAGVGLATGVGPGAGVGVGLAPGLELGEFPGVVVAGVLLAAEALPPQELRLIVARRMARTETAKQQSRKKSPLQHRDEVERTAYRPADGFRFGRRPEVRR